MTKFLASIPREQQNIVDFIVALNQRLQRGIGYVVRMDPGVQSPEETLRLRQARVATRRGCWCKSFATSASRRASYPAT